MKVETCATRMFWLKTLEKLFPKETSNWMARAWHLKPRNTWCLWWIEMPPPTSSLRSKYVQHINSTIQTNTVANIWMQILWDKDNHSKSHIEHSSTNFVLLLWGDCGSIRSCKSNKQMLSPTHSFLRMTAFHVTEDFGFLNCGVQL